ncbi:MAG: L-histidine N(alpha)-methyltransferase, partial [Deltaproteobacteria bacterium]|nr:L-histidine N(alpha)-methyltransferase [Deltaproteobacteria bacterium]
MTSFKDDVLEGLSLGQKAIPPKYFYDERGSALFERICELPEYYLTRTERGILETHIRSIVGGFGPRKTLLELGSGASLKTRLVLNEFKSCETYVPIDISEEFLFKTARALAREYPRIKINPVCADFLKPLRLPLDDGGRVLFFPGSTIGNFEPLDALKLLQNVARLLGRGGRMLLGVDLFKDVKVLEAAYNDSQGVTAAFNLNVLARMKNELGADFNLNAFNHRAFFNPEESRIEMHLESTLDQVVR